MNCEECGADFEVSNRAKRFCSEKCRRKAEKRRWKARKLHATQQKRYEETGLRPREQYCRTCGAKFTSRHNGEAYCSATCRGIGYEKTRIAGREAARQRYYDNKKLHQLSCKWCGSSFETDSKVMYCSDKCRRAKLAHSTRLRTYGLSQECYDTLLERSGGLCEICQVEEAVHIDHCHGTGEVRGLLCQQCNHGLGNFQDDVNLLAKAVKYLKR